VERTFYGDANGDGAVDASDLAALASHWQSSGFWMDGDFDYNGIVDVNDLALLAANWQSSPSSLEGALAALGLPAVSVPEPTFVASISLIALSLASGRWRRANRTYNARP
jgi:hypothetical protein